MFLSEECINEKINLSEGKFWEWLKKVFYDHNPRHPRMVELNQDYYEYIWHCKRDHRDTTMKANIPIGNDTEIKMDYDEENIQKTACVLEARIEYLEGIIAVIEEEGIEEVCQYNKYKSECHNVSRNLLRASKIRLKHDKKYLQGIKSGRVKPRRDFKAELDNAKYII